MAKFRDLGATVLILSEMGKGVPDLIVGVIHPTKYWLNKLFFVEVKDGDKPPSQQKLTIPERNFIDKWASFVYIINSEKQVEELMNTLFVEF